MPHARASPADPIYAHPMVILVSGALACIATLAWLFIVPRVRIADPEAPDLATLVTWPSALAVGIVTLTAAQVLWLAPVGHWWVWGGYLALGVPLVSIDLRTTFLPSQLTWVTLLVMALGAVPAIVTDPGLGPSIAVGAGVVFAFFYLAWRIGGQLGFGDVRLGALTGAVSGLSGVQGVAWALVAGTAIGALHAIGHLLWARRDPSRPRHFPYGPSLYAGPLIAAVVTATAA